MTDTNELRKMLDERGVKWEANDTYRLLVTSWKDVSGHSWAFMEHRDGNFSKLTAYHLTPAQAIAATLGAGTCQLKRASWDDGTCTWGCICSACDAHLEHETGIGYNYCPICGAKVVDE